MNRANGTFDVKLTPAEDSAFGRMSLDKQFHGDLEGTSKGEMLTAVTNVKGSAAYVGIERLTAWIAGTHHIRETIPFPRMLYRIYP